MQLLGMVSHTTLGLIRMSSTLMFTSNARYFCVLSPPYAVENVLEVENILTARSKELSTQVTSELNLQASKVVVQCKQNQNSVKIDQIT